jgi:hypothetical protein
MEFSEQGIKIDHKINGGEWKCQEEYGRWMTFNKESIKERLKGIDYLVKFFNIF